MINRNFELTRQMGDYNVIQRTQDGFFDASNLIKQWNSNPLNKKKSLADIARNKQFQVFAKTLAKSENLMIGNSQDGDNQQNGMIGCNQSLNSYGIPAQLMVIKRGRKGCKATEDQVWMNPYLFTKLAMSLNPEFEVAVIKFVTDQLIAYRNKVADSYKGWSATVKKLGAERPEDYKTIQRCMNYAIFGRHQEGIRDFATTEELNKLSQLEEQISQLVDFGMIKNLTDARQFLKKVWMKNFPTPFTQCELV